MSLNLDVNVKQGAIQNIDIIQGSTFIMRANVKDSDDSALSLSDHTGFAIVKGNYINTGIAANFEVDFATPGSGVIELTLRPTGSAAIHVTKAIYELEVINNTTSETRKYLRGVASIFPELVT